MKDLPGWDSAIKTDLVNWDNGYNTVGISVWGSDGSTLLFSTDWHGLETTDKLLTTGANKIRPLLLSR